MAGQLMGVAGVSLGDFSVMYLDEIRQTLKAAHACREAERRDDWERMRLLATMTIMPHVSKRITPQRLMPLPWDVAADDAGVSPRLSRAERQARFKQRMEQMKKYDSGKTTVYAGGE